MTELKRYIPGPPGQYLIRAMMEKDGLPQKVFLTLVAKDIKQANELCAGVVGKHGIQEATVEGKCLGRLEWETPALTPLTID